jgi:hypothetical protein
VPAELAEAMVIMGLGVAISLEEYVQMSVRLRDDLLIIKEAEVEQMSRQRDAAKRGRR